MASNFRINSQKKKETLYMKLSGDFDGTAALELIYALKEKIGVADKIFIDTNGLKTLVPFGRMVFNNNFDFSTAAFQKIVFTGDHRNQIYPHKAV
ncbi:MAG: hypothetical protein ACLFNS_04095 [Desulfobacterales bacterium]